MSYLTLKKYEYINHGESYNEYVRRFNSYDSRKIGIDIGSNPAFFVETKEIRDKALLIHKLDKTVIKLRYSVPEEAITNYMMKCLIDEIQITNSIEGVHSTKKEILAAYKNQGTRFKGIVSKYILMMSGGDIPLHTCQDIRKLYNELVLPEVLEESNDNKPDGKIFRKGRIYVSNKSIEPIHEGLYPEDQIIDAMTRALVYLNNENEELLYRVAVFHYLIGYIHPFYDGNGRMNRFISSYMLARELDPVIGYRLSYTVKTQQSSYNKAFIDSNDKDNYGELTGFVDMFMDVLIESMQNLIAALTKRSELWNKYTNHISQLPYGNEKYYPQIYRDLILHELFAPDGITIADLKESTQISEPTLRKILSNIESTGLLKTDSTERRYKYGIFLNLIDDIIKVNNSSDGTNKPT